MNGYGYSIWLLVNHQNISELRTALGGIFGHVLHITLKTNIETLKQAEEYLKTFPPYIDYSIEGNLEFSSKMYKHDPLNAWIFPVKIKDVETEFSPHVSIQYLINDYKPPYIKVNSISGKGKVVVADTRDLNPRNWRFFW